MAKLQWRNANVEPVRALLAELDPAELARFGRACRVAVKPGAARGALLRAIAEKLDTDELADKLRRFFPKTGRAADGVIRLDRVNRLYGETTIQTSSRADAARGELLLALRPACLVLRLVSVPVFLENRQPVIVRDAGEVPRRRLYAAFVRPRKLHPAAEGPPGARRPFIIDEGDYTLRAGRLRLELKRAGPVAFRVGFLRLRRAGLRPSYLLTPIA